MKQMNDKNITSLKEEIISIVLYCVITQTDNISIDKTTKNDFSTMIVETIYHLLARL